MRRLEELEVRRLLGEGGGLFGFDDVDTDGDRGGLSPGPSSISSLVSNALVSSSSSISKI